MWLVHKAGFAAAQLLDAPEVTEGKVKVKVEHSGEVLEVDEEDIEKVCNLSVVRSTTKAFVDERLNVDNICNISCVLWYCIYFILS